MTNTSETFVTASSTATTEGLYAALQLLRDQSAPGYLVDWAQQLNISEAALQASRIGVESVWPLRDLYSVLRRLPSLGRVLAITRNQGVVHEYKGCYPEPQLAEAGSHPTGLFLNIGGLDLRLFLSHWYWGCAIEDQTDKGTRRSLQFFDQHGSAVHKVFALDETDLQAWQQLVDELADHSVAAGLPDFLPVQSATHQPPASPVQLAEEWRQMNDVHQFFSLIRRHRITRFAAVQAVPDELSREVSPEAFEQVVNAAAAQQMEIMFFVGSRGCVQIYTGKTQGIKPMRGWLNVFEPDFTLHANPELFAHCFVTRKPQDNGWVTSLEIFDHQGTLLLQMYGRRDEGQPEQPAWTELLQQLPGLS